MALSHLESGGGELSGGEVKSKHCLYKVSVVGTQPALRGLQMARVWMVVQKQVSLWCRAGHGPCPQGHRLQVRLNLMRM